MVDPARILTYVGGVNASNGRRAALVAALLGLLAFLGGATLPVAHGLPGTSAPTTAAAHLGDAAQASVPTPTVGGSVRAAHPTAARTTTQDRGPAPYPGVWAVPALLLLLAGAALSVAVLRSCRRTTSTSWRSRLAARAPPALAL